MHRPLAVERVDALAEARGAVGRLDRHHGRHHLLLDRLLEELRLQHAEHVVAVLDLARQQRELLAEVRDGEVLRRHQRRRGAAEPGGLGEAEILDAGKRGKALAQGVETRQLRLHLAELHRHRVEVLLHEGARAFGFRLLRGKDESLQRREGHFGRIAQSEPVQPGRCAQHHGEREQRAPDQVTQGQAD